MIDYLSSYKKRDKILPPHGIVVGTHQNRFRGRSTMFFRRTKAANGPDGKSYYTYRLVENQRVGTKIR